MKTLDKLEVSVLIVMNGFGACLAFSFVLFCLGELRRKR